jgi:phosphoglycolate phosphatase-like HAD superfamily hydrolase
LLVTAVKTASSEGGHSLLIDGRAAIKYLRIHESLLYSLVISSKYSSFKPRPIFDETNGIIRMRFDDEIQLSATLIENFDHLRSIIYKHAYAVTLEQGQGYVVDNHRYLHGRTSFTGSRELLRILVNPNPLALESGDSSMPKKFVFFDIDGTLCRFEALSIDAFYRCISDVANMHITVDNTLANLHGQTDLSLVRDILKYHGVSGERLSLLIDKFLSKHPSYLGESTDKVFPSEVCAGAPEVLNWLNDMQKTEPGRQGFMGLLTGNSRSSELLKLQHAGVAADGFDLDISAFGDKCPSRTAMFHDAIWNIEAKYSSPLNAQDVMLIGDTPLDIECAKKVGCKILAVATGNYSVETLQDYEPDFICSSLPEGKEFIRAFLE